MAKDRNISELPFQKRGRRKTPQEIKDFFRDEFGLELVSGFHEVLRTNGATKYRQRVGGCMPMQNASSWYINQTGKNWIEWETDDIPFDSSCSAIVYMFSMAMGNGSPLPQPSGQFDLLFNGNYLLSFRVVKHSETWFGKKQSQFHFDVRRLEASPPPPGQSLHLDQVIKDESFAAFGLGMLKVPLSMNTAYNRARIRVVSNNRVSSNRWFKIDSESAVLSKANIYTGLRSLINGKGHPKVGDHNVYFGDIHTHSGEGRWLNRGDLTGPCGVGSFKENFRYAKSISNLDIFALTDHDWQIDNQYIEEYQKMVDEYCESGKFVTLPGYEWTSSMYGHRNIYYRDFTPIVFDAKKTNETGHFCYWKTDVDSPADLWNKLDQLPTKIISVPHHPTCSSHPFNWDFLNPKYDRLVEIYSSWGSSEYPNNPFKGSGSDHYNQLYVRKALDNGIRLGFLASSDGHDGHPGNAQSMHKRENKFVMQHLYHYLGSGLIAVLAPELTRGAIFNSMYKRRCYATTGEPIVLGVNINGFPMGSKINLQDIRSVIRLTCQVHACANIKRIDIIRNGSLIEARNFLESTTEEKFTWLDHEYNKRKPSYYYVRVIQTDGEMAWSSPIFISP